MRSTLILPSPIPRGEGEQRHDKHQKLRPYVPGAKELDKTRHAGKDMRFRQVAEDRLAQKE
jgi:hypothetical protein